MARNLSLQIIAALDKRDLKSIKERDFSVAIREYAEGHGWLVHYQQTTGFMGSGGKWRAMAPGGWPDLIMARNGEMIAAELKREIGGKAGEPREDQRAWLSAIDAVEGASAYHWKPHQSAEILERLR